MIRQYFFIGTYLLPSAMSSAFFSSSMLALATGSLKRLPCPDDLEEVGLGAFLTSFGAVLTRLYIVCVVSFVLTEIMQNVNSSL